MDNSLKPHGHGSESRATLWTIAINGCTRQNPISARSEVTLPMSRTFGIL